MQEDGIKQWVLEIGELNETVISMRNQARFSFSRSFQEDLKFRSFQDFQPCGNPDKEKKKRKEKNTKNSRE